HGLGVLTRLGIHTDAYGCQVGAGENDELVALARARCHQRSKELPKTGLAPLLLHTVTPLTVLFFCRCNLPSHLLTWRTSVHGPQGRDRYSRHTELSSQLRRG